MKGISERSDTATYDSFPAGWKKLPLAHAEDDDVTNLKGEKLDEGVCLKNGPKFKFEGKERMVEVFSFSKMDDLSTRSDSEIRY